MIPTKPGAAAANGARYPDLVIAERGQPGPARRRLHRREFQGDAGLAAAAGPNRADHRRRLAGSQFRGFRELRAGIQRGEWRRRCERRHRCPKLDGLSSPCLSSPKGSTVPVVSPIPPFATTGTVPFFLQMAKHRPPRATESTPMLRCEKLI